MTKDFLCLSKLSEGSTALCHATEDGKDRRKKDKSDGTSEGSGEVSCQKGCGFVKMTDSGTAKPRLSLHTVIFRAAFGLFVLTMLSVFLVCGMFAKYVVSGGIDDSAHVQGGIGVINVLEHEARETGTNSGMYMLNLRQEVPANTYRKVLPGVDIPKDPFIRLTNLTDTACELYVQVTESKNFPEFVSYALDPDVWENLGNGVYKYRTVIDSSVTDEIYILQDNQLNVSEHYVGNGGFSLTFSAWLVQKGES